MDGKAFLLYRSWILNDAIYLYTEIQSISVAIISYLIYFDVYVSTLIDTNEGSNLYESTIPHCTRKYFHSFIIIAKYKM